MESKHKIKLDIGKIIDSNIFDFKPTFRPGEKIEIRQGDNYG